MTISSKILLMGVMPASPEFVNTPLDLLLSKEGRKKIEEAIDDLPVLYRSVIVLRDVEGFSLKEVSKIMDSSLAACESCLHRARNSVRLALNSYYVERDVSSETRESFKIANENLFRLLRSVVGLPGW